MTAIALKDYGNRDAWLARRRTAIGASEAAGLFTDERGNSLSPFTTPLKLWAEKTGQVQPDDLTGDFVEIGTLIEPVTAEMYVRRTGRKVFHAGPFCVAEHPRLAMMTATPDRWVIEAPDMVGGGVLQCKNTNQFRSHDWDTGVPQHIEIQVQDEMAVTGREWASVAVIIGGSTFRSFDVYRNQDFIAELEEQCRAFWDLVERRVAPAIDGSPQTLEIIKKLHPKDNGQTVRLPEEAVMWFAALEAAKNDGKVAEVVETWAKCKLLKAIGDATYGELPDGRRLSLKTTDNPGSTTTVAPYAYRVLRLEKAPTKTPKKGKTS